MLPAVDPRPVPCKVCASPSPLCGLVDFHKSCAEAQGKRLPLSGDAVYYRQCPSYGFLFTDAFDTWTDQDFLERIYNDQYIQVDPDYLELRPSGNAQLIANTFATFRSSVRILDYGGGNGVLADRLRQQGFAADTYDQFSEHDHLPSARFDLITCFEVAEHAPNPKKFVASLDALLAEGGMVLFSTLVQPADFDKIGLGWWYVGPRNGHVSLYSRAALSRLFAGRGLRTASFNDNLHVAYRAVPAFAKHLGLPA